MRSISFWKLQPLQYTGLKEGKGATSYVLGLVHTAIPNQFFDISRLVLGSGSKKTHEMRFLQIGSKPHLEVV